MAGSSTLPKGGPGTKSAADVDTPCRAWEQGFSLMSLQAVGRLRLTPFLAGACCRSPRARMTYPWDDANLCRAVLNA